MKLPFFQRILKLLPPFEAYLNLRTISRVSTLPRVAQGAFLYKVSCNKLYIKWVNDSKRSLMRSSWVTFCCLFESGSSFRLFCTTSQEIGIHPDIIWTLPKPLFRCFKTSQKLGCRSFLNIIFQTFNFWLARVFFFRGCNWADTGWAVEFHPK